MGGWVLCIHTYLMCVCMCVYTHLYKYRRIYIYMYTHTSEGITPNLAVLSFEANIFEAIYLQSSGFILMFNLGNPQYSISTLHKYFNRSQRVRPIPWKMKWQRFYNS